MNYGPFLMFEIDPLSLGCCIRVYLSDKRLGDRGSEEPLGI